MCFTIHLATPKVKETVHNMLVRPKIEYRSIAGNPWHKHRLILVHLKEKHPKSAARFILNDQFRRTSVCIRMCLKKHGWDTLETLWLQHQL